MDQPFSFKGLMAQRKASGDDQKVFDPRKLWNQLRQLRTDLEGVQGSLNLKFNQLSADLQNKSEVIKQIEEDVEILESGVEAISLALGIVIESLIISGAVQSHDDVDSEDLPKRYVTLSYVHMDDKSRPSFGSVDIETSALYETGESLLVEAITAAGFQPSDFAQPGKNQNIFRILFTGTRPEWSSMPILETDDQRFQEWISEESFKQI